MTPATLGIVLVAMAAGYLAPRTTQAYPAYKDKEGVSCVYCHVKPGGPRNYRGAYYKKNMNTFAKFDDFAEAIASGKDEEKIAAGVPKTREKTGPITEAHDKVVAAEEAMKKTPDDAALKTAYVKSVVDLTTTVQASTAIPVLPRAKYVQKTATSVLALDPENAAAKDLKAKADADIKTEEEKAAKAKAATP